MKKDGFNPRINKIKNVNKMTNNELDETNKHLEKELKKRKLNLKNLENFKGKIHQSPTSKTKTCASNNDFKDSIQNINTSYENTRDKISKKIILTDNSFISLRKENSPNYSNAQDINIPQRINSNSNLNINSEILYKPKREYFTPFEDFISKKDNKQKTIKKDFSGTISSQIKSDRYDENFSNYNYKERLNQSYIHLKTHENYKNLIPFHFKKDQENDEKKQFKQCLDKLKLCQKIHLPKEKNYFISEKNIKLLENAINEKECDINILRSLLNMAKDDIDLYKNRYESINIYIDEILNENKNIIEDLEKILEEKKKIKENFDEYIDKYNKILTFMKKIFNIIKTNINIKSSFEDFIVNYFDQETYINIQTRFIVDCEKINDDEKVLTYIKIPKNAEFLQKLQELIKIVSNPELKIYMNFFDKNILENKRNILNEKQLFYFKTCEKERIIPENISNFFKYIF